MVWQWDYITINIARHHNPAYMKAREMGMQNLTTTTSSCGIKINDDSPHPALDLSCEIGKTDNTLPTLIP